MKGNFYLEFSKEICGHSFGCSPNCSLTSHYYTECALSQNFSNLPVHQYTFLDLVPWIIGSFYFQWIKPSANSMRSLNGIFLPEHSVVTALHFFFQNCSFNPLNPELNPICYLLALLAHHFLHVSRIRVKSLTLRLLMSYIYGTPILDASRSHTTTHHSR